MNCEYQQSPSLFIVPYASSVSKKLFPVLKKHNFKLVYSCKNKLAKFIKTGKDMLDLMSESCVIYKINCKDCNASYVRQTKRQLRTRLKKHRSDINKRSGSPSIISTHRINFQHDFEWNNVEILNRKCSYDKNLVSEMIHIKKQSFGINKQRDTESFPDLYIPILNLLP